MRTRLLLSLAVAAAAAVLPVTNAATAAPAAASAPPANPTTVHEWLTTPGVETPTDASLPLNGTVTKTPVTVHVDPNVRYQSVSGFGAAITDSSANVLYGLTPDNRTGDAQPFQSRSGAGINFLRQPIGASDFVVDQDYSYDDMPAGQTDYQMRHFTVAHDETQILPLLRQALKLNPRIQIVASPWSMPGWMKTSGSMIDGKLIDDPKIYRAYALYLVKFVQAYQRAGVTVDYLTVQNEPQALERKNYPGTDLPWQQEAKVIEQLGPAIQPPG